MNDPHDLRALFPAPPSFTCLTFAILSELQLAHRTERVPFRFGDFSASALASHAFGWSKNVSSPGNETCLTFSQVLPREAFLASVGSHHFAFLQCKGNLRMRLPCVRGCNIPYCLGAFCLPIATPASLVDAINQLVTHQRSS